MSKTNKILRNISAYTFGGVLEKIVGFILTVIIARYLHDIGLGKYAFSFAYVHLFMLLVDFGTGTLLIREVSRDKNKTAYYLNNAFMLKLVLGIFFILILPSVFFILTKKDIAMLGIIFLASLAIYFDGLKDILRVVFIAYEESKYIVYIKLVDRLGALILSVILMIKFGLIGLMLGLFLSYLGSFIFSWVLVRKRISTPLCKVPSFNIDIKSWINLFKLSWPFWLTVIFTTLYFRIDTVMISYFKDYSAVGLYSAASGLIFGLSFIPGAVVGAVYPSMSKYFKTSKKLLKNLYIKTLYYLILLVFPIAIGTTILAEKIILTIYGKQFIGAAVALQILVWVALFVFIKQISGALLNSVNKQKKFTLTIGICSIFNIILNLILIPYYSYIGASIATLFTEILNFVLLIYFVNKENIVLNFFKLTYKPFFAGIVMAFFIFKFSSLSLFSFPYLNLFFLIGFGALIYFVVLFLIKGIGVNEINLIRTFIKSR